MFAIETKNLSKHYGSKQAVKSLNLKIKEGELFSLLGVNGAGKTTTIRMLTGLAKPSGGDALVYGNSVLHNLDAVKQIVNLSPQETAVAGNLTVKENLIFMAQIYGADSVAAKAKMEKMVEDFSLQDVLNSKAKTLSGGWQRRLSIAMALITEPKILFLDEPTLGLDVLARRELWNFIRKLKGKMTIVLTTHYMEESEALSDRIAVMVNGEVVECGTLEELEEISGKNNLEEAFVAIVEGGMNHEN